MRLPYELVEITLEHVSSKANRPALAKLVLAEPGPEARGGQKECSVL